MEFHLTLSTIVATFVFVLVAAFLILNKSWVNNRKPTAATPSEHKAYAYNRTPSLPRRIATLPHKYLGDLGNKYDHFSHQAWFSTKPWLILLGEIAKECYTTNDKVFASRPKSKAVEIMGYNYAMFGLAPYGDYWRQLKASLKDIHGAWENNKESAGSNMVKVDMKQWFGTLVLNIVVRVISGKRFPTNDEEGIHFQNVIRKIFELLGAFVASDYIPYMDRFDLGGYEKEMMLVWKEMDNIMDGWLQEHKREKESGQQLERNQVFLDVLISSLQGAPKEDFPGFDHDIVIKETKSGPTDFSVLALLLLLDDLPISFVNMEIYFQRRKHFFIPLSSNLLNLGVQYRYLG
ncbi:cytochrome P450 CYP82D47-like protein [Tanacetum coccineum]